MKFLNLLLLALLASVLAACATTTDPDATPVSSYADRATAQSLARLASPIRKEIVDYETRFAPGTIIVETSERRLYLVMDGGKAMKYGIGVGREGMTWSGTNTITRKAEWPDWRPTANMLRRDPTLPRYMEGGIDNPLGARALYIGSTMYRLHGTAEPWTIGHAVSSGCIRLTNEDIVDLYDRVQVGARVIVRH